MDRNVKVWYDSKCPLCEREIALMRRLDTEGAIDFVDVYSARECPLEPAALLQRFHAQESDGPLVSGAAAFAAMWRAIPRLRWLGRAAAWPPLLWLLERAYRLFLLIRPRLQRALRSQAR